MSTLSSRSGLAQSGQESGSQNRSAATGFPNDFVWGTATSSYQVEGAVNEDGRGPSIWDRFAHTPGTISDRSTGDIATDHFHRYKEDVQLMKALGAKAYRFSIAWPRVFPEGSGSPNPKGLDFYNRLLDELAANGIEPFVTLYHWDLPQALQDRHGGWTSRETSKAFADYAAYVAARLGDRVKHYFTINECSRLVHLGHGIGADAPGLKLSPSEIKQVRHHVALGHGLAVQAIRAHGRAGTRVGPAENAVSCIPAVETPANIRAAEMAMRELNAGYLTVMLEGKYTGCLSCAGCSEIHHRGSAHHLLPDRFCRDQCLHARPLRRCRRQRTRLHAGAVPRLVPAHEGHLAQAGSRNDVLGASPRGQNLEREVDLHHRERNVGERPAAADGTIYDVDRIMYLRNYLTQLQRATSEGVPVRGYFLWSLMDNFEWSDGYEQRFGLYHVDFATQRRTPKLSASFYRETIARNAVA